MAARKTCPVFARVRWEGAGVAEKSALHILSHGQNPVGLGQGPTMGWLVFLNGGHRGEDARLPLGATTIGAAWNAQLVVTAPEIRSHHATITTAESGAVLAPAAPGHDVHVNGERINAATPLHDGDLVSLAEQHAVILFARLYKNGLKPAVRPRPPVVAAAADPQSFTAAWLIAANGAAAGRDWRLVRGENRIGSGLGVEVTVAEKSLPPEACRLACDLSGTRVAAVAGGVVVTADGRSLAPGEGLRDSARIAVNGAEFWFKCL